MTTASELKSAAVVEGVVEALLELRAERKTSETRTVNVVSNTAVNATSFAGSTTATATKQVASAHAESATPLAKAAKSGSRAATLFRAASIQATRLPVSIFPKISRLSANTQQNPVPLWQTLPEGLLRAGRAS